MKSVLSVVIVTVSFTLKAETMDQLQSLIKVIITPHEYYGKTIVVSGYMSGQLIIYPTKEFANIGVPEDGLPLVIKNKGILDKLYIKEGYVAVTAKLCKSIKAYNTPVLCEVESVTFLSLDGKQKIKKWRLDD